MTRALRRGLPWLALLAAGCGMSSSKGTTARDVSAVSLEAQGEVARLEGQIAHLRDEIGLPPGAPADAPEGRDAVSSGDASSSSPAPSRDGSAGKDGRHSPVVADGKSRTEEKSRRESEASPPPVSAPAATSAPTAPAPAPAPQPAPGAAAIANPVPAAPPPAEPTATTPARRRPQRCRDIASVAEEICHASGRICTLAAQIDDDGSRRSCGTSRDDCRRARELAERCQ